MCFDCIGWRMWIAAFMKYSDPCSSWTASAPAAGRYKLRIALKSGKSAKSGLCRVPTGEAPLVE
jgi:hypothetical protein